MVGLVSQSSGYVEGYLFQVKTENSSQSDFCITIPSEQLQILGNWFDDHYKQKTYEDYFKHTFQTMKKLEAQNEYLKKFSQKIDGSNPEELMKRLAQVEKQFPERILIPQDLFERLRSIVVPWLELNSKKIEGKNSLVQFFNRNGKYDHKTKLLTLSIDKMSEYIDACCQERFPSDHQNLKEKIRQFKEIGQETIQVSGNLKNKLENILRQKLALEIKQKEVINTIVSLSNQYKIALLKD